MKEFGTDQQRAEVGGRQRAHSPSMQKVVVAWGGPAQRADEIPDFEKAVQSLRGSSSASGKL